MGRLDAEQRTNTILKRNIMEEMNLKEQLAAAKNECERMILKAIELFEKETGFVIESISLCHGNEEICGNSTFVRYININVGE